jgi:hypothetical protein
MTGFGRERKEQILRVGLCGLVCAALVGFPAVASAREKRLDGLKMVGQTTAVEPARVTIRGAEGHELTVLCQEDFTSKVGLGSKVTVWYTSQHGVNTLVWMEYPLENFFVPADLIRSQIKKIIPLPNATVPDSEEIVNRITKYLEVNLGWYVAPSMLAQEIRRRSPGSNSTLGAVDPATGQFDMNLYLQSQGQMIAHLASETRVDAVLGVDVEQVQAKFIHHIAEWDGVWQPVAYTVTRLLGKFTPIGDEGEVPAATVVMKLWDSRGKLLWSNRRGFAVLALRTGPGNNFRPRPLTEVYHDEASVQRWLVEALGTLAPAKTLAPPLAATGAKRTRKP